jgi:GNAT superfamily N-acetyltransferase
MIVKRLESDKEIVESFDLMCQLVYMVDKDYYLSLVRKKETQGYLLFGLFDEKLVSLIGVRFYDYFSSEKILIIDDFVTEKNNRKKGYGSYLFNWIESFALKRNCSEIRLDSKLEREIAHSFYKKKGMILEGYHFCKKI